jgi:hypothetical protein
MAKSTSLKDASELTPDDFKTEAKSSEPGLLEHAEMLFDLLSEISDESDRLKSVLFGEGESKDNLLKGPSVDSVLGCCFQQATGIKYNLELINAKLTNK